MQLEQYLNYFSKSNILITTLEDLYSHRLQTLQEVFRFLDVDDSFYNRKFFKIKHKSNYKRRKNLIGLAISQIPGINIVERLPFVEVDQNRDRGADEPRPRRAAGAGAGRERAAVAAAGQQEPGPAVG